MYRIAKKAIRSEQELKYVDTNTPQFLIPANADGAYKVMLTTAILPAIGSTNNNNTRVGREVWLRGIKISMELNGNDTSTRDIQMVRIIIAQFPDYITTPNWSTILQDATTTNLINSPYNWEARKVYKRLWEKKVALSAHANESPVTSYRTITAYIPCRFKVEFNDFNATYNSVGLFVASDEADIAAETAAPSFKFYARLYFTDS